MKKTVKNNNSKVSFYKKYTWIIFVFMWILPLINIKFGILALISMIFGITQAFWSGKEAKPYCAYFCPRGGGLQKFLSKFSLGLKVPTFLTTPWVRYGFTVLLSAKVIMGIVKAKSLDELGAAMYLGFVSTTILAIVIGILLKPRTYCGELCHAANIAGVINKFKKKKN